MNDVLLSKRTADIRAADEQAAVLIDLYTDEAEVDVLGLSPRFVADRLKSLRALRAALQAELASEDVLPKGADPEVSSWHFFVDRVKGLIEDQPHAVPLAEETRLLELIDALRGSDFSDPQAIDEGRRATERAADVLGEE